MDPSTGASNAAAASSPTGLRTSLPSLVAQVQASGGGDGIFSALSSPPLTPTLGSEGGAAGRAEQGAGGKQVFSDFRRFVSFAVRRERGET